MHPAAAHQATLSTLPPSPLPPGTVLAGTGHRPEKLTLVDAHGVLRTAYEPAVTARVVALATAVLTRWQPSVVISGMALGWDLALAEAAVACGIPLQAFVPCESQPSRWAPAAQRHYATLLTQATEVRIVAPGPYAAWKMTARNQAMVDAVGPTGVGATRWDGSRGGTADCVARAVAARRMMLVCWPFWVQGAARGMVAAE